MRETERDLVPTALAFRADSTGRIADAFEAFDGLVLGNLAAYPDENFRVEVEHVNGIGEKRFLSEVIH